MPINSDHISAKYCKEIIKALEKVGVKEASISVACSGKLSTISISSSKFRFAVIKHLAEQGKETEDDK